MQQQLLARVLAPRFFAVSRFGVFASVVMARPQGTQQSLVARNESF